MISSFLSIANYTLFRLPSIRFLLQIISANDSSTNTSSNNTGLLQQLAIANEQVSVANQQLFVANQQVTVSNQQLAVASEQLTVAREELSVNRQQLAILMTMNSHLQRVLTTMELDRGGLDRPQDCQDILSEPEGYSSSGTDRVYPGDGRIPHDFLVYCDMTTDGGGWTVRALFYI